MVMTQRQVVKQKVSFDELIVQNPKEKPIKDGQRKQQDQRLDFNTN